MVFGRKPGVPPHIRQLKAVSLEKGGFRVVFGVRFYQMLSESVTESAERTTITVARHEAKRNV